MSYNIPIKIKYHKNSENYALHETECRENQILKNEIIRLLPHVSPHIAASRFLFYAVHQANNTTQRVTLANHHHFLALILTLLQCRFEAFHPVKVLVCHLDHNRSKRFCWLQAKYSNLSQNGIVTIGKIQKFVME
jgi:hypothetical protein